MTAKQLQDKIKWGLLLKDEFLDQFYNKKITVDSSEIPDEINFYPTVRQKKHSKSSINNLLSNTVLPKEIKKDKKKKLDTVKSKKKKKSDTVKSKKKKKMDTVKSKKDNVKLKKKKKKTITIKNIRKPQSSTERIVEKLKKEELKLPEEVKTAKTIYDYEQCIICNKCHRYYMSIGINEYIGYECIN